MRPLLTVSLLFLLSFLSAKADDVSAAVLREMNLARTAPREYARILAESENASRPAVREAITFLNRVAPLPPFEASVGMDAGAQLHVVTQGPQGTMGHTGIGNSRPWDRVAKFGQWQGIVGENIAYGRTGARAIVATLIIDEGVRGRGHRKNIFHSGFHVAGVSVGRHARFGTMCVIDFAGGFKPASAPASAVLAELSGRSQGAL